MAIVTTNYIVITSYNITTSGTMRNEMLPGFYFYKATPLSFGRPNYNLTTVCVSFRAHTEQLLCCYKMCKARTITTRGLLLDFRCKAWCCCKHGIAQLHNVCCCALQEYLFASFFCLLHPLHALVLYCHKRCIVCLSITHRIVCVCVCVFFTQRDLCCE